MAVGGAGEMIADNEEDQPRRHEGIAPGVLGCTASHGGIGGIAGHADITTTARYDRRGEGAKRWAVQALAVPRQ